MSTLLNSIKEVIILNGGELSGRTRLQKTFYFLKEKGADLDIDFSYHRYGPYSADLAETLFYIEKNTEIGIIVEGAIGGRGTTYKIPESNDIVSNSNFGSLEATEVAAILSELKEFTAWELELAATMHHFHDKCDDLSIAREEVRKRKPLKASDERLDRARTLLERLGLLD